MPSISPSPFRKYSSPVQADGAIRLWAPRRRSLFVPSRRPSRSLRPREPEPACGGAELHRQAMGVAARRLEVVGAVEARGVLVDRVHDDELAAGGAGGGHDLGERVDEQLVAKSLALKAAIQGELREQDRGNRARSATADPGWRFVTCKGVRGDRKVAGDCVGGPLNQEVGAGALARRLARVQVEPLIEVGVAAGEGLLQESLRKLQADIDSRLDTMTQAFEYRSADDEADALAAERIRSGAAERTQDGAEALSQLGIHAFA